MLSDLQVRVARMVARLPEAEGFALAGGAGLIVHQVTERETSDLDFFTPDAARVARLLPALEEALRADGLEVTRQRVEQDFVRLTVADGAEATVIDLATDFRLRPPVDTDLGKVVAPDELAADKLLALAGRIEARDYTDVSRLVDRYGLERLCDLAQQKDPGFQRWALADMLRHFARIPRDDFEIDDDTYAALASEVIHWRSVLEGSGSGP